MKNTHQLNRTIDRLDRLAIKFYEGKASTVLIVLLAVFDAWVLFNIVRTP
jgi:hypothetical protein